LHGDPSSSSWNCENVEGFGPGTQEPHGPHEIKGPKDDVFHWLHWLHSSRIDTIGGSSGLRRDGGGWLAGQHPVAVPDPSLKRPKKIFSTNLHTAASFSNIARSVFA